MYPYDLRQNPYPSSPTPTISDAKILGGKRHIDGKLAVLSCIDDLHQKMSGIATDKDFRLVTLIQDVGSGKTHLSLHIKGLEELSGSTVTSYVDLSQISPRDMNSLYRATLSGFTGGYIKEIKESLVYYLKDKAERNIKNAKKVFRFGIFDSIRGKSLTSKAQEILQDEFVPDCSALHSLLREEFSSNEISIFKLVLETNLREDTHNTLTLEDIIGRMAAISALNWRFLRKITILQLDECDADKQTLDFIKAVVNAHLPSTILMLVLTPSSYEEIQKENVSVFDRLEKANYKIDLAGSNTKDEIIEILLEYIRQNGNKIFTPVEEKDLTAKIKVIYDEFQDFRNIRSMINILYHAMEDAKKRGAKTIDEEAIDNTIRNAYPGLRIQGSIMGVPLSDFIRIHRTSSDDRQLESDIRDAVINLLNYAYENGSVAKLEETNGKESNGIDLIYNDQVGTKIAVAVLIDKDRVRTFKHISNTIKSTFSVDKFIILTTTNVYDATDKASIVNIDNRKMIDLIYFSSKYRNHEIMLDDSQRALMLAKSIKLC
ncbi:MAG TPA: hypothetical protein VJ729_07470 [Nitrososphaeraceae archaeon]|nr:hypothetical protein [Nitrososphaeraceae archaeon]